MFHWVYFSVHGEHRGTIVDLVHHLKGASLAEVRKELRAYTNTPQPANDPLPELRLSMPDLVKVRERFERMSPIDGHHAYLENERKIPAWILDHPRFAGRIRVDDKGSAIFPHWNNEGLCGYEIKNRGFTGFAKGGQKGLWASRSRPDDHILVIAETAIDALSWATLHPAELRHTRVASTAGILSPDQRALVTRTFEKLPPGAEIRLAMDNDKGGERIAQKIGTLLEAVSNTDLAIRRDLPHRHKDWNDILRRKPSCIFRRSPDASR